MILKAAGKLMEQHGIGALNVRKIAKASGTTPALVYICFGSIDNLRSQCLKSIGLPPRTLSGFIEKAEEIRDLDTAAGLKKLMLLLWDEFRHNELKLKMLSLEIATGEPILSDAYDGAILKLLKSSGEISGIGDTGALAAFLSAAIYFISASTQYQQSMVGINLKSEGGIQRIENVIDRIIESFAQ